MVLVIVKTDRCVGTVHRDIKRARYVFRVFAAEVQDETWALWIARQWKGSEQRKLGRTTVPRIARSHLSCGEWIDMVKVRVRLTEILRQLMTRELL